MNDEHTGDSDPRSLKNLVRTAFEWDDARASWPCEHGGTLAASVALTIGALLTSRRELSVLQGLAAGVLLFRSLSGRDGLRAWANTDRAVADDHPHAEASTTDAGYSGA